MRKIICLYLTKLTYNISERKFMKKKLLSLVAVSALLASGLTALAACGASNPSKKDDNTSEKTSGKFVVSYQSSEDYEVKGLKEEYAAGETVTFTITIKAEGKEVSSVRATGEETSVRAKFENGQFSFEMPNEDVSLRITLSDIVEPVLSASYSGKTVVGETLTISASIDEVAISDFTVTAKVGANLVTVSGKQVTLNAVGAVTLEIAATKDSFNLKKDLSFAISAGEASYGQNITYDDHAPTAGIESSTKTHRGTIITCGVDGGSISSLTYNKANNEYTMNYTNGWEFWSVQLFFDLPYAEQGDTYHFAWDVNSDVAGQMTISGHAVDLQQGDNYINFDVTQGSGALISIQFGVNGGTNLGGEVLKFSPFRLYDADAAHKYHHVTFVNGTETLKDIYVRDGKTVVAPEVTVTGNYLFQGFFEGTTPYQTGLAVTKDYAFVASIVEKSAENTKHVTIKLGSKTLKVVDVFNGSTLVIPTDLDLGFGRSAVGYFKDAAFTQPYNLDSAVTTDFDLYVKTEINFEATYTNEGGLGYQIPSDWVSHDASGAVTITFNGWGATGWYVQANFDKSVPVGEAGKQYTITFTYSINVEGGTYQIYDGNSIGAGSLEVGTNKVGSITYEGGSIGSGRKLTFELGGTPLDQQCVFTLSDIVLTIA